MLGIGKIKINKLKGGKAMKSVRKGFHGLGMVLAVLVVLVFSETSAFAGAITWDKTFGGSDLDVAYSIVQTSDGGYIVAGYTWSKGAGKTDALVIKLDKNGNLGSKK